MTSQKAKRVFLIGIFVSFIYLVACIAMRQYTEEMRSIYHHIGRRFYTVKPHVFLTRVAGGINVIFIAYFLVLHLRALIYRKKVGVLVLSICGIFFTTLVCLADYIMVSDAKHITFDEIGLLFALFGFIQLSFITPMYVLALKDSPQ